MATCRRVAPSRLARTTRADPAWLAITQEAQGIAGTTYDRRIEGTDAPAKLILMSASGFRDPLISFYIHHECGHVRRSKCPSRSHLNRTLREQRRPTGRDPGGPIHRQVKRHQRYLRQFRQTSPHAHG